MNGLISLRLPEELIARLDREANRTGRARSEILRDAVVEHLARNERERFLGEIARAARERGVDESLQLADEALSFDNESWKITEGHAAQEPGRPYRARKKRRS